MIIATYNIDGLPSEVDLKDLPWILKPICWIYKIFKKTTIVKINDNNRPEIMDIMSYLAQKNIDITGVQEDFFTFRIQKLLSYIKWFPYPRLNLNGINIYYNHTKNIKIIKEKFIPWEKSYGYFSHANDRITTKGFKFYNIKYNNVLLDLYVVHLDADFYDSETNSDISGDIQARASQLKQLSDFIIKQNSKNPAIIMGDFNCSPKNVWDNQLINDNFLIPLNNVWEVSSEGFKDVDRIFVINNGSHTLLLKNCYYDTLVHLSDHQPFIAEFEII